jgi:hypothetical protein
MRHRLVACCLLPAVVGCSPEPYRVAPVSGKVTLNGKPLPNACVHFAPIGSKDHNPGPTSQGKTDSNGCFTLRLDHPPQLGAVVGKCRVFITTANTELRDGAQPDAGGKKTKELVPARYNQETTLIFDVPPGGTDQANFDLKSP